MQIGCAAARLGRPVPLLVPAAWAAPGNIISDPLAEPTWTFEVNGPAADSSDAAVDVRMASGGVTWVCGNVQTPSGMSDVASPRSSMA